MKLLMENKKKQITYVAVLAACFGLLGWIWLPQILSSPPAGDSSQVSEVLNLSASSVVPEAHSLLPYGEDFDTSVLNDERFRALVPAAALILDLAELGRSNPFLPPGEDAPFESSTTTATSTPAVK